MATIESEIRGGKRVWKDQAAYKRNRDGREKELERRGRGTKTVAQACRVAGKLGFRFGHQGELLDEWADPKNYGMPVA